MKMNTDRIRKKLFEKIKKINDLPTGTLTVFFIIAIVSIYLALAYRYLYIPNYHLIAYGFMLERPLTVLSYSFIHLSPQHILANVALLFAVGIIAEKKLDTKDYVLIFFISAITSGIIFHILTPYETVLVGASSAISGILAASIFIDLKKALIAILIFGAFLHVASPMVEQHTRRELGILEEEAAKIEGEAEEIEKRFDEKEQKIQNYTEQEKSLEYLCYEELNETACEELEEIEEKIEQEKEEKEKIERNMSDVIQRLLERTQEKEIMEEGVRREEESRTSTIVHLVGAITGLIYLGIFRRDIIWNLPSQVLR